MPGVHTALEPGGREWPEAAEGRKEPLGRKRFFLTFQTEGENPLGTEEGPKQAAPSHRSLPFGQEQLAKLV